MKRKKEEVEQAGKGKSDSPSPGPSSPGAEVEGNDRKRSASASAVPDAEEEVVEEELTMPKQAVDTEQETCRGKARAIVSKVGACPSKTDSDEAQGDSSTSSSNSQGSNDLGEGRKPPASGKPADDAKSGAFADEDDGVAKGKSGSGSSISSNRNAPSGGGSKTSSSAAKRAPRATQSLEELNASAESVRNQKDLTAEEIQREMGVIYSRRKRVRQKMRVESLELKKHTFTQDNLRLRRENAELEGALRCAVADVAAFERRLDAAQSAAFSSGNPWAAAASRLPYPPHQSMPFAQPPFSSLGHRPLYLSGAGYPGMGFYGPASVGLHGHRNPVLNRILPAVMGGGPEADPASGPPPSSTPTGTLHPGLLLSPQRGRSGEVAGAAASGSSSEAHSPLPPSLHGMDPVVLQRHFLGLSVVPRMEERLDRIPVQDLQELLHHWSGTSPDAATLLDEYLRRRLHHQSRW